MRAVLLLATCLSIAATMPAGAGSEPPDPREAVLRMATQKLADAVLEDAILAALAARQVDVRGATIRFTGLSTTASLAADAELTVERLTWQPATQRFVAVLMARTPAAPPQRISAIGQLSRDAQVPVPVRALQAGQVIAASDVEWMSMGERRLPANIVREPSELIGRMPRRGLPQGAPVTTADLKRPVVVARGAQVIIVIGGQNMRLTARGQALDEGAIGDTVRVVNAQSHTVVTGVVRADGQVDVTLAAPRP